jgi:hypothetical protein
MIIIGFLSEVLLCIMPLCGSKDGRVIKRERGAINAPNATALNLDCNIR